MQVLFDGTYQLVLFMLRIFLLAILTILPGSWLTLGLPLDALNLRTRIALGAALSPAVLAIQFIVLKFLGLDFSKVAIILLVINLPALLLLKRHLASFHLQRPSKTFIFGFLLFFLLAGIVALPWVTIPNYRQFAWHALMHTDMVYGLARGTTFLPEDPELAGLTLSYVWTGDLFWSILGWLTNWSPTSSYWLINLIWLLITFVLAYELAKEGMGLESATALLSVGTLFTGTGIIGTSIWLIVDDRSRWGWILGSVPLTAIVGKYRGFEVILFAFAILVGLVLVSMFSMRNKIKHLGVLVSSLLIGLGVLYPILFPMGCIIVGGLLLLLVMPGSARLPQYERSELFMLAFGLGASIITFLVFLVLFTQDRTGMAFQFAQAGRKSKILQALSVLLPFLIVSIPYTVKSIRQRNFSAILLAVTSLCMMGLYVFTSVSQLEYKFILVATISLAPLSAATINDLFRRLRCGRWVLALAVPLLFGGINLFFLFRFYQIDPWGGMIPRNLENAPIIEEDSFWIALNRVEKDAEWSTAVRELTPVDTILIVHDSQVHIGPFVNRALYFPSDRDGQAATGYSVDNHWILVGQRGYSESIWQQRLGIIQAIYDNTDPSKLAVALEVLQSLNRPLAILFPTDSTFALTWLKKENRGYELFSDTRDVVWFLDRPEAP